jgi:sugar phosphate isomerase/epimerase
LQVGISNIAWGPDEDDAVGEVLRAAGVAAVELAPTKYWPPPCSRDATEVAELRRRWEDRGQRVVALQSLLFGMPHLSIFGDTEVRQATSTYLETMLEIGSGLGVGPLVFGSPRNRIKGDRSFDQAVTEAADFFRPLARRAHDLGVVLTFEPNPTAYQCDFANTVAEALRVVESVDHPGLALHLDIGIMQINGEPFGEAVALARSRMTHVHISEPQLAAVPGDSVDHAAAAGALRAQGWDRSVSIEMRGGDDGRNVERVARAVAFAREVYHD